MPKKTFDEIPAEEQAQIRAALRQGRLCLPTGLPHLAAYSMQPLTATK
jgi:hypothetical protein